MKFIQHSLMAMAILLATGCQSKTKPATISENVSERTPTSEKIEKMSPQDLSKYETAYFASGCFWCVEAIFESVRGVKEVISGYAGGTEENPTYEMVGSGQSSHAEAVEVYYDPSQISFVELVQVFFGSHDPTTLNRQGPDRGTQYRSIAFYKNEQEKKIIDSYIQALKDQNVYGGAPITTEVTAFTKFYDAEDYHQDYERKHPNNSYIRNVSIPRLNRFKANFGDYLKKEVH
ncbi:MULTISPECIES: peptide-methionine (S)-S-oxide reductase MsrA [Maribacter]|uniref:Peptide methionine sulfoxide reductase MsrA n=2 Tax=Maribacter flavus TaxID=1658664 RepID=A0ABU7IL26_9FLAO|nr:MULTISPECIES: peptide-methionine (S)-S-oxide reductase MsrA [Maribacter]MDC6406554.1 peptide-methionine (S)-S-oxide reductase MsrA [Maribacter sp. PR66]MEE1973672.1 peptide-methionine (S)-S-oxide reductase MsrA [Maribacter flavus]